MRRGSDGVTLRVTNFPKKFYLFAFPPRGKVAFAKQMTDEGKLLYAQFSLKIPHFFHEPAHLWQKSAASAENGLSTIRR